MRSVGLHLALVWMAASATACFEHSSPRSDSQSHWLWQCDETADCSSDLACICGVCTERCDRDGDCNGDTDVAASCTDVDSVGGCAGASGSAQVCLAGCSDDGDCRAGGDELECVAGSCVARAHSGDAGTATGDGVLTVEGRLECDALLGRVHELKQELDAEHDRCETHADCTCVDDSTRCGGTCGAAIRVDAVDLYSAELAAISEDYCSAPDLYMTCPIPSASCAECASICRDGRCQARSTSSLCMEWSCANGRLCHVDGTCVDPGAEDGVGIATLAMAAAPPEAPVTTRGIRQFAVEGGAVFWLDVGTFDAAGEHNGDGMVHQQVLESAEGSVLVRGLGFRHPGELRADGSRVYYTDDDGVYAVPRDASAEPLRLFARTEGLPVAVEGLPDVEFVPVPSAPWIVDGDWIYYAEFRGELVRRVRADGTGDEVFYEAGAPTHRLAANATHLFVELQGTTDPTPTTSLLRVDKETRVAETVVAVFREQPADGDGPLLVAGDFVVIDAVTSVAENASAIGIRRYSISAGERVDLLEATSSTPYVRSLDDGLVYFAVSHDDGEWIGRFPLEPAEPQQLRTTGAAIGHVMATDGHLYWVESHRLLRMPLRP